MLLTFVGGVTKTRSMTSAIIEESSSKDVGENLEELGYLLTNLVKPDVNDVVQDHSKFKKVEMSIFNGVDPNSWLFE